MLLKANFDGGCRQGEMSVGCVVTDGTGTVLHFVSESRGEGTNNIAEYQALLEVLKYALSVRPSRLEIRGDSRLVIGQVTKNWRCNFPHLRVLRDQAQDLVRQLRSGGCNVGVSWVPRRENSYADKLAGQAIRAVDVETRPRLVKKSAESSFVVTDAWIRAYASSKGGWTNAQLAVFEQKFPPEHGWKKRAIGRRISLEQKKAFEDGKHILARRKRKIDEGQLGFL